MNSQSVSRLALVLATAVPTALAQSSFDSAASPRGPSRALAGPQFAATPVAPPTLGTNLVINGDFETYTGGACDSNLTNAAFTAAMPNATGFGLADEIDVYANPPCFGNPAPSGQWKVAIHKQVAGDADAFSLDLSSPVVAGQSYNLSFWAETVDDFDTDLGRVEIGLSNSASSFGTLVYTAASTFFDTWEFFSTSFTAPIAANYLTVRAERSGVAGAWTHIDNFQLDSVSAGGRLFGVNSGMGGDFLVMIDKTNGNLTTVGNTGITCDGLAFAADGTLYAADNTNARLVTLNPATGAVATVIGPFNVAGIIVEGMTIEPGTGDLYGIDVFADTLVRISTTTGQATTIGSFNGPLQAAGLSFSISGATLYMVDWSDGCLYTVNSGTGNATQVGCDDPGEPLGLATDPATGQLYSADWTGGNDMILSLVNELNGDRVDVGVMVGGQQIEGLSFEPLGLGTKYCTTNANSTGSPADISASGSASSAAGNLTLTSAPVPNQNGIFFHGANQSNIPFGNGTLCTIGGIRRGAVVLASGNSASYTYDNSGPKRDLSGFVNTTRHFQNWFRDPMGGGAFFNTSNAISIQILP